MKSLLGFLTVGIVALAANGYAQESKKPPDKAEVAKATYLVTGLY